jgi:hypothetical protein
MCDHDGCSKELVTMDHLDAVSARIHSTNGGWKYFVAKVGVRPRGGGYRKFDYCPEHAEGV